MTRHMTSDYEKTRLYHSDTCLHALYVMFVTCWYMKKLVLYWLCQR